MTLPAATVDGRWHVLMETPSDFRCGPCEEWLRTASYALQRQGYKVGVRKVPSSTRPGFPFFRVAGGATFVGSKSAETLKAAMTGPAAVPSARVAASDPDRHSHVCGSCKTEWWHSASAAKTPQAHAAAHRCPKCGRSQTVVARFAGAAHPSVSDPIRPSAGAVRAAASAPDNPPGSPVTYWTAEQHEADWSDTPPRLREYAAGEPVPPGLPETADPTLWQALAKYRRIHGDTPWVRGQAAWERAYADAMLLTKAYTIGWQEGHGCDRPDCPCGSACSCGPGCRCGKGDPRVWGEGCVCEEDLGMFRSVGLMPVGAEPGTDQYHFALLRSPTGMTVHAPRSGPMPAGSCVGGSCGGGSCGTRCGTGDDADGKRGDAR